MVFPELIEDDTGTNAIDLKNKSIFRLRIQCSKCIDEEYQKKNESTHGDY
jgi:hypothetical protein